MYLLFSIYNKNKNEAPVNLLYDGYVLNVK